MMFFESGILEIPERLIQTCELNFLAMLFAVSNEKDEDADVDIGAVIPVNVLIISDEDDDRQPK